MGTYVRVELEPHGAIAEAEIAAAAVRLDVPVFTPLSDHGRSDLVLEIAGRLWRVQCKWGRLGPGGDVVVVHVGGSWLSPSGYVRSTYAETEVDLFGIYCADLDRSFLLPIDLVAGKHEIRLRLTPARNGQQACTTLADAFAFDGAIAQLGERSAGSRKVVGSSPTSSTSSPEGPTIVGSNPFRDKLGHWRDRVAAGEEVVITRHGRPRIRLSPATAAPAR